MFYHDKFYSMPPVSTYKAIIRRVNAFVEKPAQKITNSIGNNIAVVSLQFCRMLDYHIVMTLKS